MEGVYVQKIFVLERAETEKLEEDSLPRKETP